jgi:hypothetical protein
MAEQRNRDELRIPQMEMKHGGAALLVTVALVACSGPGPSMPDGLYFPTVPRQDAYPSAVLSGQLVERSGCVLVASGHRGSLPLWPEGYTATRNEDGRVEVLDENGAVIGREDHEVALGGGSVTASFDPDVFRDAPDGCGHRYWLVSPVAWLVEP